LATVAGNQSPPVTCLVRMDDQHELVHRGRWLLQSAIAAVRVE
jgi:hypothetical protein